MLPGSELSVWSVVTQGNIGAYRYGLTVSAHASVLEQITISCKRYTMIVLQYSLRARFFPKGSEPYPM